jgi:hypothetical protein
MTEYDPHEAINYIFNNAPEYAKAKGQLAQLEAYKSSLKAIMMKKSTENSLGLILPLIVSTLFHAC